MSSGCGGSGLLQCGEGGNEEREANLAFDAVVEQVDHLDVEIGAVELPSDRQLALLRASM